MKKLSEKEHNELIQLNEDLATLYVELGQVEIEILELTKHKSELHNKHIELKNKEFQYWESIKKQYGDIKDIDIQTGEIK